MDLVKFATWAEVLAYARTGGPLYYQAPLNVSPVRVWPMVGTGYTAAMQSTLPAFEVRPRSLRLYPPDCRGQGRRRTADPFTADAGHLDRFRKPKGP